MASSDVDIGNMALAHIGDEALVTSITPSDGTVQGDHLNRVYVQVRDWLLERFAWKFATTRATLALRSDIDYSPAWTYVYAEPNNCLRMLSLLPSGYSSDDEGANFDTEVDSTGQGLILTNTEDATARYITRVSDPARFTPGFTEAFTWFLAAALAGPIIKGETGRQEALRCWQVGATQFASATGLSANQARRTLDHIPAFMQARGSYDAQNERAEIIR